MTSQPTPCNGAPLAKVHALHMLRVSVGQRNPQHAWMIVALHVTLAQGQPLERIHKAFMQALHDDSNNDAHNGGVPMGTPD